MYRNLKKISQTILTFSSKRAKIQLVSILHETELKNKKILYQLISF